MAERAARIGERRLGRPAVEPGALDAGDGAVEIGDGGEQRRPGFARVRFALAVIDGRVEAQGGQSSRAVMPRARR